MIKKLSVFIFIVFEKPWIVRRHIPRRFGDPDRWGCQYQLL